MALYAIADLHLSFAEGVDKPMDIYGGAWIDHEEKLRRNWTGLVKPEDTVVIPGDISWALYLRDAMADSTNLASGIQPAFSWSQQWEAT